MTAGCLKQLWKARIFLKFLSNCSDPIAFCRIQRQRAYHLNSMKQKLLTITALVLLTFAAFSGVSTLQFVSYDDPDYITSNAIVQQGFTKSGLVWAFGNVHGTETYWHPITWLTHMMDCQFFGLNAGAHHLTSLAFHAANVVLLFLFLNRATGAFWTSAII